MENKSTKISKQRINRTNVTWLICMIFITILVLTLSCSGSINKELDKNEQLWKSKNIKNYDFTLTRDCFCPEDVRGPVNIQVRNGLPASVKYVTNGQTATPERFGNIDTIDELFNVIRNAYEGQGPFNQKAQRVDVTYDPDKGYPLTIFIDVSLQIADEEQGFTVENFVQQ